MCKLLNCKHWISIYRHDEHRIRNGKKIHSIIFSWRRTLNTEHRRAEQKIVRLKWEERGIWHVNWDKISERKTKLFWSIHVDCCCYTIIKSVVLAALTNTWMDVVPRVSILPNISNTKYTQMLHFLPMFTECIRFRFIFSNSVCVHNSVIKQLVPITDALFYRSRHITHSKIHNIFEIITIEMFVGWFYFIIFLTHFRKINRLCPKFIGKCQKKPLSVCQKCPINHRPILVITFLFSFFFFCFVSMIEIFEK